MFVQVAQDYTPDLLKYLRQEPEEQEWATAGSKRHKSRSANDAARLAPKPLALFDHYCTEGKMLRHHVDDRQGGSHFKHIACAVCCSCCRELQVAFYSLLC